MLTILQFISKIRFIRRLSGILEYIITSDEGTVLVKQNTACYIFFLNLSDTH
jgi:hypothetical protein